MSFHLQDASDYTSQLRRKASLRTVQTVSLGSVFVQQTTTPPTQTSVTKYTLAIPQGIPNQFVYDIGLAECQDCSVSCSAPSLASSTRSFRGGLLYSVLRCG
jgi:hypothetical protein